MELTQKSLRILLVDDHAIVRAGLRQLIKDEYHKAIIDEASSYVHAIKGFKSGTFDLVVTDVSLGDRSGIELIKELKMIRQAPVLVLSMHPESQYALRALKAGAAGYLTKDTASDEMSIAIRNVLLGKRYVSPKLGTLLAEALSERDKLDLYESLSDREFDVLKGISKGKSLLEISNSLSLSVSTISTYRSRILQKMKMKSNAELIQYAIEKKII